jgi:hypothetical protein
MKKDYHTISLLERKLDVPPLSNAYNFIDKRGLKIPSKKSINIMRMS